MTRYTTNLPCRLLRHGDLIERRGAIEIEIDGPNAAARVFADRYARRRFGRRGYCHHVRTDSWTSDGRIHHYEAFIGLPAQGGGTSGMNVWLTVTVQT